MTQKQANESPILADKSVSGTLQKLINRPHFIPIPVFGLGLNPSNR